jgi:hypothetical protein
MLRSSGVVHFQSTVAFLGGRVLMHALCVLLPLLCSDVSYIS